LITRSATQLFSARLHYCDRTIKTVQTALGLNQRLYLCQVGFDIGKTLVTVRCAKVWGAANIGSGEH